MRRWNPCFPFDTLLRITQSYDTLLVFSIFTVPIELTDELNCVPYWQLTSPVQYIFYETIFSYCTSVTASCLVSRKLLPCKNKRLKLFWFLRYLRDPRWENPVALRPDRKKISSRFIRLNMLIRLRGSVSVLCTASGNISETGQFFSCSLR